MPPHLTPSQRTLRAVINPASGSVPAEAEAALSDALSGMGHVADITITDSDALNEAMKAAVQSGPDVLIAWGGDGTIACALSAAGMDGPAILPLPGGTMNMLHTRVFGEFEDWNDVLQRGLSKGEPRPIPAGEVGDRRFYVAAMLGRLVKFTETREALRDGQLVTAAQSATGSGALNLDTALRWTSKDAGATSHEATAIALSVDPDNPDAFDIASIDPDSLLQLAQTGIEALMQGWQDAGSVDLRQSGHVDIASLDGAPIAATLDGERLDLPQATSFRLVPEAARVLAPARTP